MNEDVLGKCQIDMVVTPRIEEQVPVMARLLDHLRVQCIPIRPVFLPHLVAVDHSCEPRIGVGIADACGFEDEVGSWD